MKIEEKKEEAKKVADESKGGKKEVKVKDKEELAIKAPENNTEKLPVKVKEDTKDTEKVTVKEEKKKVETDSVK